MIAGWKSFRANYQMNNYLEEFVAMQLLSHGKVFEAFPKLRIVICHCGGGLNRFIPTDHHIAQKDLTCESVLRLLLL